MKNNYFKGTEEQATIIAKFLYDQHNIVYPSKKTGHEAIEILRSLDDVGMPDTEVRVLYDNGYDLVFITIDSGIEVVFAVKKYDITKNQSIEL